jgi:hypothetical protein
VLRTVSRVVSLRIPVAQHPVFGYVMHLQPGPNTLALGVLYANGASPDLGLPTPRIWWETMMGQGARVAARGVFCAFNQRILPLLTEGVSHWVQA